MCSSYLLYSLIFRSTILFSSLAQFIEPFVCWLVLASVHLCFSQEEEDVVVPIGHML